MLVINLYFLFTQSANVATNKTPLLLKSTKASPMVICPSLPIKVPVITRQKKVLTNLVGTICSGALASRDYIFNFIFSLVIVIGVKLVHKK